MKDEPITADSIFQTWVLYGPSGVGKTTLAATAPKPLIGDTNQGLLSIADMRGLEHVRKAKIRRIKDLNILYDRFTGTDRKMNWLKKYKTLVFDHFDDVQGIILDELGDLALEKDDRREIDQIEQREWGILRNKLARYVRKFKRVPIHKILICAEMMDHDTGRMKPHLLGGLKDELPFFVDHTLYYRIGKKGRRYIHLNSSDNFYAKTRARWLKPEQRKIYVPEGDTTALTKLFDLIAAGPRRTSHKRHLSRES